MPPPSSPGGAIPVAVVIPAYNREATVGRAVASVLSQTRGPAEIIVVDDGSTDGTGRAAAAAGARVVRQDNGGVSSARNRGIEAATQEWIALLDSDDEWEPDHLERLWAWRDGRSVVADSLRSGRTGQIVGNPLGRPLELRSPADVLFPTTPVSASTVMFRRTDALAVGGFPSIPLAEDLEMWCRLLERGPGISLPGIGGVYHEHADQASRARVEMRAAVADLLRRSAGRPWMTRRLEAKVTAVLRWDELRAACADRRWRVAGGAATALMTPSQVSALPAMWRWRAASRASAPSAEPPAWPADQARYGRRAWWREQSWWAIALYRFGRWNDRRGRGLSRTLANRAYWLAYRPIETITGISLDKGASCGPGLRIHHFGGITVHSGAVLGAHCTLRQGVTIGERVSGGPVPVLEDDVDVGAHAQILGGVRVGKGARIGALALVLEDVPPGGRAFAPRARIEPPSASPPSPRG